MSRQDGIRTAADLRLRCLCRSDDECWIWRGATDKNGAAKVWFPEFGTTSTIGPVIAFLRTGIRPKKAVWLRNCNSAGCVNPEHWGKASHSLATRRSPRRNPVLHTLNVAIARRASSKLNDACIADMRTKAEGAKVYAERYQISRSSVSRIQRGEAWKPLAMPGNSVFNLGAP